MNLIKVFCSMCGQKLGIETNDLRHSLQCPRCQFVHRASDLVSPSTTIMPARVEDSSPGRLVPATVLPSSAQALRPHPELASAPTEGPPTHDTVEIPVWRPPDEVPASASATTSGVATTELLAKDGSAQEATARGESGRLRVARDGLVRAVDVGRSGMVVAGATMARLLDLADRFDRHLHGRRGRAIVAASALVVVVAPILDATLDDTTVSVLLTLAFALFLATLGLARIASFRDEDGRWSWTVVRRRLETALSDSWSFGQDFSIAGRSRKLFEGGRLGASLGIFALAMREVLRLMLLERGRYPRGSILVDIDTLLFWCGWLTLLAGAAAWWRGRHELAEAGHGRELLVEGEAIAVVERSTHKLPVVIDLGDPSTQPFLSAAHPLLADFLGALSAWRPRRFAYEDQYQASLHRHLLREIPDSEPERERPIESADGSQRGRADLVLGRCVLVEMKRKLDTSSAQRALGQLQMYAEMWRHKGPIVVLMCDAGTEWRGSFFGRGLEQMRTRGVPIVAVLPARGRSA